MNQKNFESRSNGGLHGGDVFFYLRPVWEYLGGFERFLMTFCHYIACGIYSLTVGFEFNVKLITGATFQEQRVNIVHTLSAAGHSLDER